ncbi:TPA: hypothetical protein ACXJU5_005050, partial [Enterobacter ludwigii]
LGRNDLLIRTFLSKYRCSHDSKMSGEKRRTINALISLTLCKTSPEREGAVPAVEQETHLL